MRYQSTVSNVSALKSLLTMLLALVLLVGVVPQAAVAEVSSKVAIEPANYSGTYYYVQYGDSLSAIALRYGVSVRALMNANGIYNANQIYVGQRLYIPGGGGYGGCAKIHYVRFGQSLSAIAAYYGISVYTLARANGIYNLNHIYVGQRLCIPSYQNPNPRPYPKPQPQPHPPQADCRNYRVKRGDTLAQIAYWYGTTVQAIVYANHLPDANHLYVGQPLTIPGTNCPQNPNPAPYPTQPNPQPTAMPKPTATPVATPGPAPQGYWLGDYYDNVERNGTPKFTRNDAQIDFKWGDNGPGGDIQGDRFGIHWRQSIYFSAGTYRFYATSDDGISIYTDDQNIIDAWRIQPATNYFGDIELGEGYHTIYVDYYEETGNAEVRVWWEKR